MLYAGVGEADSLSPPFIIQSNRMAGFLEEKLHWEEMLSFFCLKWHSDGSEFICLFSNCIRCCLFRSFINYFHQLLYLATILQRAFTGCTNKMERNCFNAMRCFGEECNVQVLLYSTWYMSHALNQGLLYCYAQAIVLSEKLAITGKISRLFSHLWWQLVIFVILKWNWQKKLAFKWFSNFKRINKSDFFSFFTDHSH